MTCRALAGKRDVLAQQIVGIRSRLGNQLHAVIGITQRIARQKLNVIDQFIQHRRIGFAITDHTLLIVISLLPEFSACIPGGKLHNEFFIGLIHY